MTIDSHQHFWKYNPIRDSWITDDMKVIQRDFMPSDLGLILEQNGIDGCVSVQADQSEEETLFLLDQADKNNFIKGVVGWVDLRSANLSERLDYFSTFKKLKGFRHIVQAEPDTTFLLQKDFMRGIKMLKHYNFTYDILVFPKQLEATLKFVYSFPDQPFVIDHLAKPHIRENKLDNWKKEIHAIGSFENVYCKLSGMVTEANWNSWKYEDFLPYLDVVLESFGAKRVMYGSDWPVCLVAGAYEQQLYIIQQYISKLSLSEQDDIMGGNAVRFYNL